MHLKCVQLFEEHFMHVTVYFRISISEMVCESKWKILGFIRFQYFYLHTIQIT